MSNGFPDTWPSIAAFTMVVGAVCGAIYMIMRSRLGADFMPRSELAESIQRLAADHAKLETRVGSIEQRILAMATRTDVQKLESRVLEVAGAASEMKGALAGLEKGQDRIFAQLQLLTRAQMPQEGAGND